MATVSSWTPVAEPRYVETVVGPPTPAEVAAAQARGELPQLQEQEQGQEQQQQQATRVSDFSSLYSAAPHRGVSKSVLAPFAPGVSLHTLHGYSFGERAFVSSSAESRTPSPRHNGINSP